MTWRVEFSSVLSDTTHHKTRSCTVVHGMYVELCCLLVNRMPRVKYADDNRRRAHPLRSAYTVVMSTRGTHPASRSNPIEWTLCGAPYPNYKLILPNIIRGNRPSRADQGAALYISIRRRLYHLSYNIRCRQSWSSSPSEICLLGPGAINYRYGDPF